MKRAYKFRLYPREHQKQILEKTLNTCRHLYNGCLAERKNTWEQQAKSISYKEQKRALVQAKKASLYLPQVHSQVLQDVVLRLDRTFQNFFRRIEPGKQGVRIKAGYPRFKSRNRYDSFTYPQYGNGCEIKDGRLWLSKIGNLRIFMHRPIEGDIKTCTIRRDVDKWYACFTVETPNVARRRELRSSVGIDMGLTDIVTLNNGEKIMAPKHLRKSEKQLRREQRRLSRRKRQSNNRRKQRLKLARRHRRIRYQRLDFAHKVSRTLVNQFDLIGFEKLNIPGMMRNHRLAKSISDAGWQQIQTFTVYKAAEAGGLVRFVNPSGTTSECSKCGFQVPKELSVRIHTCPRCGLIMGRDLNSAKVVEKRVRWGTAEFTPVDTTPLQPSYRSLQA